MNFFVTAIGTDSGKTLTSAILCEALHADYWKPVQAGIPRDSDTVRQLLTNRNSVIHNECYQLKTSASPHAAAKIDNVHIDLAKINLPNTDHDLVIEGAGGCLVPLNEKYFVVDIIKKLGTPVILVANLYLGSINHTLLTIEALKKRSVSILGIVFNGERNYESENIIVKHADIPVLLHIDVEKSINRETVKKYADTFKEKWNATSFRER